MMERALRAPRTVGGQIDANTPISLTVEEFVGGLYNALPGGLGLTSHVNSVLTGDCRARTGAADL